jgi:predicted nucleic acid-binding Zn finger protein
LKVNSEVTVFREVYGEAKESKRLTHNHKTKLIKIFGARFENAYKAVEEGRVVKYVFSPSKRVVWMVAGKEGMYQILPQANFCSCNDFYFRVIGHEAFLCYHLIAQKLAKALDKYVNVNVRDGEEYESLMGKLREIPVCRRVLSIEEVENIRRVVSGILSEEKHLTLAQLLEELRKAGFKAMSTRHLTAILVADKRKRFRCLEGVWSLA